MRVYICDFCEDRSKKAKRNKFVTGKLVDTSGHGYKQNVEVIDLCKDCEVMLYKEAFASVIAEKDKKDPSFGGKVLTKVYKKLMEEKKKFENIDPRGFPGDD
jgi:hypothetical protein